ncbi:MAG: hypothetical protein HYV27_11360 [Candidatus Hydrogenedentes bacterium]|nr:hypothetical protein [Candidatus Hydrogenedentota bacterium]
MSGLYFDVRQTVPAPNNADPQFQNAYNVINRTIILTENINYTRLFTRPFASLALEFIPQLNQIDAHGIFDTPAAKDACVGAMNTIRDTLGTDTTSIRDFFGQGVTGALRTQFEVLSTNGIGMPFLFAQGPECVAAIDAVVEHLGHMTELHLYTESKAFHAKNNPEIVAAVEQAKAARVLALKNNNLYCQSPGNCQYRLNSWCSTTVGGNCVLASASA